MASHQGDPKLSTVAGYLLDTNVVSEAKKIRPNPVVTRFIAQLPEERVFISCLSLGELCKGAVSLSRRDAVAGQEFLTWIKSLKSSHGNRVLPVTTEIAMLWGELASDRTRAVVDTLLAATAMHHQLALVTRNTRDVQGLPMHVVNPWLV